MTPRRKGATPITRDRIVDAAIALIDEAGLEACTMRRIGERMGVDASSLYHHVASQAALFDLVADRIMGDVRVEEHDPAADPVDTIVAGGRSLFGAMTSHPRATRLVTERPLRSALIGEPFEHLLGAFYAAGLTPTQALTANGVIGWFLIGAALNYASQSLEDAYASDIDVERLRAMAAGLPHFTRLMTEAEPCTFDADFEYGLRALVQGLIAAGRV